MNVRHRVTGIASNSRISRHRVAEADRRLLEYVATRRSVVLDRVLPAFGRAADHGLLWMVVAAGLAATENRRARRAALRGTVSVAIASTLANLVGKNLFRRARPPITGIPAVRHPARWPVTPAFPSGHAASAAAFATAVAMEAPAPVTIPIALAAGAVAVSRVVTGAHYPSDVVAGVAVGAGAAWLTHWWWSPHPPGPAAAAPPGGPVPAIGSGAGLVVLINGGAGSANPQLQSRIRAELPDADMLVVHPGEVEAALHRAVATAQVIAVAGGDGTVNAAARHLAGTGIPLLVLPAGTLNHFAHELGVYTVDDALSALRTGTAVRVDVGRAGDQVFLNTCGFGLYTDLVAFRTRWERRIGKWPALLAGMIHVVRHGQAQPVIIDGTPHLVWMIFLGNGRYHPHGFAPAFRRRLDDARLDVRIIDAATPFAATGMGLAMLTHTVRWCSAYQQRTPTQLHIAAAATGPLRLSVDGEYTEVTGEVRIRIDPAALLVYRPLRDHEGAARHGPTRHDRPMPEAI
jgi:undecaprenyl-diphosphatase